LAPKDPCITPAALALRAEYIDPSDRKRRGPLDDNDKGDT